MKSDLADRIMEELEEKQKEMAECDHNTIEKDGDEWSCSSCGHLFVPQDSNIGDKLPEIQKMGHHIRVTADDGYNRVELISKILEHFDLDYDSRYTNSGGHFSVRGLEKILAKLKSPDLEE